MARIAEALRPSSGSRTKRPRTRASRAYTPIDLHVHSGPYRTRTCDPLRVIPPLRTHRNPRTPLSWFFVGPWVILGVGGDSEPPLSSPLFGYGGAWARLEGWDTERDRSIGRQ